VLVYFKDFIRGYLGNEKLIFNIIFSVFLKPFEGGKKDGIKGVFKGTL
jgi:hypothetical protein